MGITQRKAKATQTVSFPTPDGGEITFTFTALGATEARDLLLDHPATPEQNREHRAAQKAEGLPPTRIRNAPWNLDTYPAALISACCTRVEVTDPDGTVIEEQTGLSVDEAADMFTSGDYSDGELTRLFAAANGVCVSGNRAVVDPEA